jgi:hypothetical protein
VVMQESFAIIGPECQSSIGAGYGGAGFGANATKPEIMSHKGMRVEAGSADVLVGNSQETADESVNPEGASAPIRLPAFGASGLPKGIQSVAQHLPAGTGEIERLDHLVAFPQKPSVHAKNREHDVSEDGCIMTWLKSA